MPKYIVGCKDGHNRETQVSFADFGEFKRNTENTQCWTRIGGQLLHEGGLICVRPVYIKPQAVQFTVQAGLYDPFTTGSVQEKQLRREGYRG